MQLCIYPTDPLPGGSCLCGGSGTQLPVLLPATQVERVRGVLWGDLDGPLWVAADWHVYRGVWFYSAIQVREKGLM